MFVSVIIPVYNVEKYLPICIESVLAQNLSDFELLLIDDGSTDGSGAICERYAAFDSRISVFHTENGGASRARNYGLDRAQGEFVVFVDADDRIEPDHLQQFAASGIGEDGIAFSNLYEERPGGGRPTVYPLQDCRAGGGRKACMPVIAQLLRIRGFGWTWNKMFSRATIEKHGLRFDPELRYAEDEVFTAQYCAHVTHIVCNARPTYHYRYVPGSLLRGPLDPLTLLRTREYIYTVYRKLGYSDEVLYLTARTQFSRLRRELRRCRGWNTDLSDKLAQGIIENWRHFRAYSRAQFRKGFYDTKVLCLGRLTCDLGGGSRLWVKLIVKGLRI